LFEFALILFKINAVVALRTHFRIDQSANPGTIDPNICRKSFAPQSFDKNKNIFAQICPTLKLPNFKIVQICPTSKFPNFKIV